jgi:hypothetical protein
MHACMILQVWIALGSIAHAGVKPLIADAGSSEGAVSKHLLTPSPPPPAHALLQHDRSLNSMHG